MLSISKPNLSISKPIDPKSNQAAKPLTLVVNLGLEQCAVLQAASNAEVEGDIATCYWAGNLSSQGLVLADVVGCKELERLQLVLPRLGAPRELGQVKARTMGAKRGEGECVCAKLKQRHTQQREGRGEGDRHTERERDRERGSGGERDNKIQRQ